MRLTEKYLEIIALLQRDKTLPVYFHEYMLAMRILCVKIDNELDKLEDNASDKTADIAKQLELLEKRLDRI